ncbi:putative ABC transport system permease protein [Sulfuritortus calidifontis]|uniref:Putative ABC transport system permease protein n=1 Tax=Sulfuritortus calidifontis TaxID=1914471 RepID=A0A4R3JW86_9PROT|nr:ABC transporter permease [Sulfuritortus calidifontis]TCS71155.1 putative ABC transport system permease protein [Sulfuritortus calidifontis]
MSWRDFLQLTTRALTAHRLRSFLTLLGIAVGIAAVILLTSIGEGIHRFVLDEFTQFGTNVIGVHPGKTMTHGTPVGVLGTVRPITLEDSEALARLPNIVAATPMVQGNAEVEANGRVRRTTIYGVGPAMARTFKMKVAIGSFLPPDDVHNPRTYAVLGSKMRQELFGSRSPLGERLRIGGSRYRIVGVMESKGQVLGVDLDDSVFIPAARGLALFNREGLIEVDVSYEAGLSSAHVAEQIKRLMIARHGREDFTIITQEDMLRTLSNVLDILTFAVGALGGISLLVGGVGIVTIMTIAVSERTNEVGLLLALGAQRRTVLGLFLGEAILLAAIGGVFGLLLGTGLAQLLHLAVPALPVHTPWTFVLAAETLAALIGLTAGVLPARRAARLDPVEALRAE